MKPVFRIVAATVAAASVGGAFAPAEASPAGRYSTGRFASWVPHGEMPDAAAAALSASGRPVVLYDSRATGAMPDALFNFLLLREEYVAIAARQLLMIRRAPKAWSARFSQPYLVLDETQVYDHVRVQAAPGPLAFDCLAYGALGSQERHAFYRLAHAATASGARLALKGGRGFSRDDLRHVASDDCAAYHLAVRAKLGINGVLRGAETTVKEPARPSPPVRPASVPVSAGR